MKAMLHILHSYTHIRMNTCVHAFVLAASGIKYYMHVCIQEHIFVNVYIAATFRLMGSSGHIACFLHVF